MAFNSEPEKSTLTQRLRQTSTSQRIVALLIIATALSGLGLVGQGLYIKAKASLAQVLLEKAWSRSLAGEVAPRAWPWADTWPVAKISVPRLRENVVALKGTSGEAMAFGPGHMDGTPMPGQPGTSIFAAHRDTHFEFLKNVKAGDTIDVTTGDNKHHRYKVSYMEVVKATASGIDPHAPGESLALVTCWPFGERTPGPLRYVVHALPLAASSTARTAAFKRPASLSGELISFTR